MSRGSLSSGFFPGLGGKTGGQAIWKIGLSSTEMQISADMERFGSAGLEAWGKNRYAVVFLFLRELLVSLKTHWPVRTSRQTRQGVLPGMVRGALNANGG